MGNSLLEQMKKRGLVDKSQAQNVRKNQQRKKNRKLKQGVVEAPSEARLHAEKLRAENLARDRELNRRRQEDAERKAVAAQIRQLIETNRIRERDGDIPYSFVDQKTVKRILITQTLHGHLQSGRLAIAKLAGAYELVPAKVAEKIRQRDPGLIIALARDEQADRDEEDPYADYQIPDDLMW